MGARIQMGPITFCFWCTFHHLHLIGFGSSELWSSRPHWSAHVVALVAFRCCRLLGWIEGRASVSVVCFIVVLVFVIAFEAVSLFIVCGTRTWMGLPPLSTFLTGRWMCEAMGNEWNVAQHVLPPYSVRCSSFYKLSHDSDRRNSNFHIGTAQICRRLVRIDLPYLGIEACVCA